MFINNLAYEASAGSGKTFMLVVRYLSLLFKGAKPSKILALTFTNKAASEMSERIVETLEDLQNRGELHEIAKVTQMSEEELLGKRKQLLKEFLNSHSKIMTIDSFFTQILRKFSLYASLMPDFTTYNTQHEIKLLQRFLQEVSVANKKDVLIQLSLESKKRVGDIFTLLDQFYIKKEELEPLVFKKQSTKAFELQAIEAMDKLANIISNCKASSATVKKAVVYENFEDIRQKSWIGRESLDYRTFSKCFTPEMDIYLKEIQSAILGYNRAKEQNFFYGLKELLAIYIKAKKALYVDDSELGFADVTMLVYEILHRIKDSEFLYFRLDGEIEHMLLDEFQDTSIIQYEILRPLIEEITSGKGIFENGSFFFVGDVKQSIYRFRGGVSALFGEVAKQNNTQVEKLRVNYRSQKEVVEFVNRAFEKKIKNYTPQIVKDGATEGYVEVVENDMLLEECLIQVKRLLELGADENSIAILCATNTDGEEIKNTLSDEGISVVTETTTKLINQKSVQAVLEYLKYLYFREDIYRYNFFALIEQEVCEIAYKDINKISLGSLVKNVIEEYKLFSDEFHLIRFLEAITKYKDIEALLFEYERLDTGAAMRDLEGVRVLTVHKSKGLEYEHVIVLDRLKKAPSARDTIIYEYDGIVLQNIYLRTKGREAIDTQYANALEKERALVHEDNLNTLYVAFTRAKENLFIIKKSEKSSFDILDLECASYGKLKCRELLKEVKEEPKEFDFEELYYGTQSDLLALEKQEEEEIQAINFGVALHYALEMMESFSLASVDNALNMMLNKYGFVLTQEELEDIALRVSRLMKNKAFLELVRGECFREKALRYKNNLRYIDLLVRKEDNSWVIIDYKSSYKHHEEHLKQVRSYIYAVREITGENVGGYLCYILEKEEKLVKVDF